ncbi:nitroreductase [Pochonia chlamydosporia 170]|uniref:Nitroreductase n=1 Tax=Pochonia chlamydosporia 170 TaxID=1380566 RepID=A0A179FSI9_METCM|nr:nitroreductase [Pochonia chlamydosporia 170]OAQ68327.1 nitroreductase [Pochonia chlamydosporia 170]
MSAAKLSADVLFQMAKARRTIYALDKNLTISTSRIQELVNEATLHTPSSFNSQSNRAVVLFGAEHDKLWDIATSTLRAIVPDDKWKHTEDRMTMFKNAAGTILFFEDQDAVKGMQAAFPAYADRFPNWASQSAAMQQLLLWTGLELEGLGANLQHYNPLIDVQVADTWNLPKSWKLNAQLVFGGRAGEPGEKEFKPLEERVKVFGA